MHAGVLQTKRKPVFYLAGFSAQPTVGTSAHNLIIVFENTLRLSAALCTRNCIFFS